MPNQTILGTAERLRSWWLDTPFTPSGLVAATVILFWMQVLGHEVAHFTALRAVQRFGYPDHDFSQRWPRPAQLAFFAGGPAFTLLLIGACGIAAARPRRTRFRQLLVALGCSAATRVAIVGPGMLLGAASDERAIGRLVGVPVQVIGLGEVVWAAAAVGLMARALPRPQRRATLTQVTLGIVVGLTSILALAPVLGLPVLQR